MNDKLAKKITEKVEEKRDEVIKLAQELVKIPSESPNEQEIQEYTAEKLEKMGLEVDKWEIDLDKLSNHPGYIPPQDYHMDYSGRPNLVGKLEEEGEGRSLILMGHTDTVPVEKEEAWDHDPYGGEIDKDRIYGRGAVDMKGGVAANMIAIETIKELGELKGDVMIANVIEEELGGNGALSFAQEGYEADAGIYSEPSGESFIAVSNRGAQFFRITVPGRSVGIEERWNSPHAIKKAMKIFEAAEDHARMRRRKVKHLPSYDLYSFDLGEIEDPELRKKAENFERNVSPLSICKIEAGDWPSTLPTECVMEGSIECLPGEDIHEVKKEFKEYIQKICSEDAWLKENPPEIEWFGLWAESSAIEKNSPIVKTVQKNAKKVGLSPIPVGSGGSDLRCLTKYANTPSILYGPSGSSIHGVDEYLDIDSLIETSKVITLTVADWCGFIES
ncbi:hypothetical protein AKJ57_05150 [candidate division MSBL1 archaeon SCGC-AAA259A05]|uniref:Peptidase M20 dimerisation domain-containing protein n=1 Tax=candidate division MSBL1 archaeon SCGC-AAA259A05 TaxID=1698259 RepID=A0A133U5W2_9EURY|nr:hypothetical protein AKJ57_05150 [candidate division MSBL1 archaeon SCGC-AAA259A05]